MKLDYISTSLPKKPYVRIDKCNAYHQAGYAAAIYIGNKQKNLPDIHFQIAIKPFDKESHIIGRFRQIPGKYRATLEGGRLIADLPCCSYEVATRQLSMAAHQHCQCAFEADVTNFLTGYLAEAKYVAYRDGEVFNANLVYLGALKFYGGNNDLDTINEYMDYMVPDNKKEREQKLAELFLKAYSFINERSNWLAIVNLAEVLYSSGQDVFTCEELIALLDPAICAETRASVKSTDYVWQSL